jgi:hypothetical protein
MIYFPFFSVLKMKMLPHLAQRKDLSHPRRMKDGPKSGCIFINQPTNQPTNQPAYLTKYSKWNKPNVKII